MSPDLMHMGSALLLDSSHNDDLFIFGAVFIGGLQRLWLGAVMQMTNS